MIMKTKKSGTKKQFRYLYLYRGNGLTNIVAGGVTNQTNVNELNLNKRRFTME